jgi:hypothetical protein
MDKSITVTFTHAEHLPTTHPGVDYRFNYSYVNSNLVGQPEEESSTKRRSIIIGISIPKCIEWGLNVGDGLKNAGDDLKKVLFEYAKEKIKIKVIEDSLDIETNFQLTTSNSPQKKCPYDPKKIEYSLGKPLKFIVS